MGDEVYNVKVGGVDGKGNYAEVDFKFHVNNVSGADPVTEAKNVATYFGGAPLTAMLQLLGTDVKIDVLHAKRVKPLGGFTSAAIVAASGTGGAACVTAELAAGLRFNDATGMKACHHYIPFVPNQALVGDLWDPAVFKPNVVSFMAALLLGAALSNGDAINLCYVDKTGTIVDLTYGVLLDKATTMNRRGRPTV